MNAHIGLTLGEIFEGLSPETLKEFEALGQKSWYPQGTILFGAGETCDGIFWVSFGQVSVSVPDGCRQCLMSHIAQPGEFLGLKAALCGEPYGVTAQTESLSEVNFTSRNDFSAFLSGHPDVAFQIVQRLSSRLGVALDQLRSASTVNLQKPSN